MDPDIGGAGGWLSNLMSGSNGQEGVPGAVGQTSVGGAPATVPGSATPTIGGGLQALAQAAPGIQKAMAQPPPPKPPQITMPQPQQQPYAQALAAVMAKLNAQNQPRSGSMTPQGTQ